MEKINRLELLCSVIEIFEDFLEEKGIDVPNDEKTESKTASVIYGSDFGNLMDSLESLFVAYGIIE